jgi:hypothetical protein
MMEEHVSDLRGFVDALSRIRAEWYQDPDAPRNLWFRGQPSRDSQLVPTLYRPDSLSLKDEEAGVFEMFKCLAPITAQDRPATEWEWYYLARHHGLPSRLLDWTESALAALWFAVEKGAEPGRAEAKSATDPAVWIMDAGSLNKMPYGDDFPIILSDDDFSKHFLPDALAGKEVQHFEFNGKPYSNAIPLAVYPVRRSTRIIAQQGVFTLHGKDPTPLDVLEARNDGAKHVELACITIKAAFLGAVLKDLQLMGVSLYSLFPDPDSVAKYVSQTYAT